jgi:hypothetical protein
MSADKTQFDLSYVVNNQVVRIPVAAKSVAQALVNSLHKKMVSHVRVSYYCELQRCEIVVLVPHPKTNVLVKPDSWKESK